MLSVTLALLRSIRRNTCENESAASLAQSVRLRHRVANRKVRVGRPPSVSDGDRQYRLRGSESRTLATVGAFRVVSARDLRDHNDRPADPRSGDLRHLREEALIRTERLDGHRDVAVVLTKNGLDLLKSSRRDLSHEGQDHRHDHGQEFYAELKKPREELLAVVVAMV